jgi:AcrR family transcriptional regulator
MERTLTGKGLATRQRIVAGAADLIRESGVADTSLEDVRQATDTSKSQLFHYFPEGRAQLLVAVAQHEADRVLADQQPHLDNLTTWRAWRAWRDLVVERYRQQGRRCPLSMLVSQVKAGDPDMQRVVTGLLEGWRGRIEAGILAMQAQGKVGPRVDAARSAAALLAGLQGGVLVMLATGETSDLEAALDQGIERLRDSGLRQ